MEPNGAASSRAPIASFALRCGSARISSTAVAKAPTSSGTRSPETPSLTISSMPLARTATTGSPEAIASRTARPWVSLVEAKTNASAARW